MPNEKHLAALETENKVSKLLVERLCIPKERIIHVVCSDRDTLERTISLGIDVTENSKLQLTGTDLQYNGISIDSKVNSDKYTRACFELFDDKTGYYSYHKPTDTHLIAQYMQKTDELHLYPASFIERIVNKVNVSQFGLSADFYCNINKFYPTENKKKTNKFNFCIEPKELTIPLINYLSYECINKDMINLFLHSYIRTNDTIKEHEFCEVSQ